MKARFSIHALGLALVAMVVTGCDNAPTGLINPNAQRGFNANTAQVPQPQTIRTERAERGAYFRYDALSPQELFQCQQICAQGNCPGRCNRAFHDYLSRGISPNYHQFMPEVNMFGSLFGNNRGQGYVFNYNQFEMADPQWVNDYNNNLGGNRYYALNDMQGYCNNPSQFVDETVQLPSNHCGQVDTNYLVGARYHNDAFNNYVWGQPQRAQQNLNFLQSFQGNCQGCYMLKYGTPWGKRNIELENQVVKADLKRTWDNLLQLPKNAGMRLANGILNTVMTRAMLPIAQIEANMAAQNIPMLQRLNYFEQMASLAYNSARIPVYMTGGTCDPYYQQNRVVSQGQPQFQSNPNTGFVVGQVEPGSDQYMISCDAGNVHTH